VLAAFRSQRPDLPALFMSGYASSEMAARIPDDTRSAFLQKPFTIESLRRKVDSLLASAVNNGR
jgi:DNA-binding NtrC family response regulator